MSGAQAYLVGHVVDIAIKLLLGDKISAQRQREINRTITDCIEGRITEDEAYERLKFKEGDALDTALWKYTNHTGGIIMEALTGWILANTYVAFSIAVISGAVLHWAKKAYRKEVPVNPLEYWLFDNSMNSLGAAGAIVLAIIGAVQTDLVAGANVTTILTLGFGAGWVIDSAINRGTPPNQSP